MNFMPTSCGAYSRAWMPPVQTMFGGASACASCLSKLPTTITLTGLGSTGKRLRLKRVTIDAGRYLISRFANEEVELSGTLVPTGGITCFVPIQLLPSVCVWTNFGYL